MLSFDPAILHNFIVLTVLSAKFRFSLIENMVLNSPKHAERLKINQILTLDSNHFNSITGVGFDFFEIL